MTPDDFAARCRAAGLTVRSVTVQGSRLCAVVAPLRVTPETVIRRLGVNVTVNYGDGRGDVTLWVSGEGQDK